MARAKTIFSNELLKRIAQGEKLKKLSEEFDISVATLYRKKKELEGANKVVEKVKEEIVENKEVKVEEKEETIQDKLNSVFTDFEKYQKEGTKFYIPFVKGLIKNSEKSIMDLEHILESKVNSLSENELSNISKQIAKFRIERRGYKNEVVFIEQYEDKINSFIEFIDIVEQYSRDRKNAIYSMRALKNIGEILIPDHNLEIMELRNKVKELEKNTVNQNITDRLLWLEKQNIKTQRVFERKEQGFTAIDKLVQNYQEEFNKLDNETRTGILTDCYNEYNSAPNTVKIKAVADYVVWNDILPKKLYDLKYFLKEER